MNAYALLKLVHIIAVIIFLGNIITGLFWMRIANKTNNLSIISFTMKGIITSDKWFTIPGVIIITAGGFSAAIAGGLPLLRTGWDILVHRFVFCIGRHIYNEISPTAEKNISFH